MNDLAEILAENTESIRKQWIAEMSKGVERADLISKAEFDEQSLPVHFECLAAVSRTRFG